MSEFCCLLEAQIPPLRRYARALLRDTSRADDLIQDTLVRALAKQHLWQEGTNLRAWLFTLMHNLHVNVVRQSVREGTMVDVDDVSTTLVATSDPTASRQLRELEEAIRLQPEFAWAHYNLALVSKKQEKKDEAIKELQAALKADPQFQAARTELDRMEASTNW